MELDEAAPVSDVAVPDDIELQRLHEHFNALRRHLVDQLSGFGELDLALADAAVLEESCVHCGVGADVLEVLDEAVAAAEQDLLKSFRLCTSASINTIALTCLQT
eukprot:4648031-Amphidinium_carterae.1